MSIYDLFDSNVDYLSILPNYQKRNIDALLTQGKSFDEVAEILLSANGPENTFPFGTVNGTNTFFENLKKELESFFCNEDSYTDEKRKLLAEFNAGELTVITVFTGYIASSLGAAISYILPAVILILKSMLKMGQRAWCETRRQQSE
ncbi:hypothetical protein BSK54_10315 [Paenibacillus odorifer]|uniref:hypothetical protein n=1 Tax=Paenibacillus odorifer TaxID=189426 RepID=UPI00096D463F|nr:hypothetical protein [Paenibacillus odorifer]OME02643.1 hypothetical protein BSK54_10315 [Paenibacillus odorifer]